VCTFVEVSRFIDPEWLIEIDAVVDDEASVEKSAG
jgi:hypothetical protein